MESLVIGAPTALTEQQPAPSIGSETLVNEQQDASAGGAG
jgi:hypothetical protein